MKDYEFSKAQQSSIISKAQLCANEYGDPVHMFRALKSSFDHARSIDYDGCNNNNPSTKPRAQEKSIRVESLTASPNPNTGAFTISFPELESDGWLNIIALSGKTILSKSITKGQSQMDIHLNHATEGLYLLRLELENENILQSRFIINTH